MKCVFCLLLFLFFAPAHAHAQPYPTDGIVYGTNDTDSISYSCSKVEGGVLECQLTQTTVTKKDLKLTKEQLQSKAKKEFDEAKKDFSDGITCEFFNLIHNALEGEENLEKVAEEGLKLGTIPDKQGFIKRIAEQSPGAKRDSLNIANNAIAFCKNPTFDNYTEVISASNDRDARTCKIGSKVYQEKFKYIEDSSKGNGAWIVISEPTGPCGMINLSKFEKDSENPDINHLWNYVSKKAMTVPKGKTPLGEACGDFEEEDNIYTWMSKEHYLGCEIVVLSPF